MTAGQANSGRSWKVRAIREAAACGRADSQPDHKKMPGAGGEKPIRQITVRLPMHGEVSAEIFQLSDGIYLGDGISAIPLSGEQIKVLRAMLRDVPGKEPS